MAGNTADWVYLHSDDEKTSPKAASAMPVPAAFDDATEVVTAAHNTADEDACCSEDDEDGYSDYSNEGRLEIAYESDEDLDQLDDDKALPEVASATLPLSVPSACWDSDGATEVGIAVAADVEWSGGSEHGDNMDDQDACSDDEDYYTDYSIEGLLEGAYESDSDEKNSPEAASSMPVPLSSACLASGHATEVVTAADAGGAVDERGHNDEDACSDEDDDYSDYSNEGRLERAYQSDEDLDQVHEDASDMKKLLYNLLDDGSDQATFDLDMRKMLNKLRSIADRREATSNKVYCEGVYGGNSDYGYGGGAGYGVTSNYYRGLGGGYYGGVSGHDYYGGLSDFDYGSGRDDGCLSDFDYGSGRGYYGGVSDYDYGWGGGHSHYCTEDYYGHRCREDRYPAGLHQRTYDVPAYTQYPLFSPIYAA